MPRLEVGFKNPMTTLGDIIKAGASGVAQRLGIGSEGDVLTVSSGVPAWAAATGGGTNLFSTTIATFAWMVHTDQTSVTTGGTGSENNTGGRVDFMSGTTASSFIAGHFGHDWRSVGYDQNMAVRVWLPRTVPSNNGTLYLYLMSDNSNPTSATKYAGFRVEASAGTDTVYAVSKDGTTEQTTDVTANFGSTSTIIHRVVDVILTANTNVKFYMNGTLLATHSTNYPPNSDTTTSPYVVTARTDNNADAANSIIGISSVISQITF